MTIQTSILYQVVYNSKSYFHCVHHRLVPGKCFERHCHRILVLTKKNTYRTPARIPVFLYQKHTFTGKRQSAKSGSYHYSLDSRQPVGGNVWLARQERLEFQSTLSIIYWLIGARHPLSPAIKSGLCRPRKKLHPSTPNYYIWTHLTSSMLTLLLTLPRTLPWPPCRIKAVTCLLQHNTHYHLYPMANGTSQLCPVPLHLVQTNCRKASHCPW